MIKDLISKDTPKVRLEECFRFEKGQDWDRKDSSDYETQEFTIPVWNSGVNPVAWVKKENNPGEVIFYVGIGAGVGFFTHISGKLFVGPLAQVMRPDSRFDYRFLGYYLSQVDHRRFKSGSAQPFYDMKLAQKLIEVPLLPRQDQIKIANFLDQFSEAIKLQEESLDLLKLEKQILLEKIFDDRNFSFYLNGRLFDTSKWTQKKVSEVAPLTLEKCPAKIFSDSCYLNTEDMIPNFGGVRAFTGEVKLANVIAHRPGDILINRIRPYLKKIWLAHNSGGTSGEIYICRPDKAQLIPEFAFMALSTNSFVDYLMKNTEGTKMPRATKDSVAKYKIKVPSLQDQQLIAGYFSQLDERISLETERLELLKLEQKVVLSKIFAT